MWRRRWPLDGLDADIRAHLEQETDDYISRGVTPEEARRLARLAFGNVAIVREDVRAVWEPVRLEQLLKDIGFGLRLLRRTPLFTTAVVLSLALGIGANTAIFRIVLSRLATLRVAGLLPTVDAQDPLALGAAAATLLTVAGIAAYLPARRAARIAPMEAVRAE